MAALLTGLVFGYAKSAFGKKCRVVISVGAVL